MLSGAPEVISRFFDITAERDADAIVALFADSATVLDEATTHRGLEEIRAWRNGAATAYTYTTELFSIKEIAPGRYLVAGRLTGNFPGGTADLKWDFTIDEDHITRLVIA